MSIKTDSDKQFDMSYSGDGRFAEILNKPAFFIVTEASAPDTEKEEARNKELFKFISDDSRIFATAVMDRLECEKDNSLKLAEDALAMTGKSVICLVSGKAADSEQIAKKINAFRAMGIRDFIAVTGNLMPKDARTEKNDDSIISTGLYTDSVDILETANETGDDNCLGATVNPFKYTREMQAFQYVKMMRKINAGTRFIVSQAGWDMKKYQEMLWFLRSRNVLIPVIARIMVGRNNWKGCPKMYPGVQMPLFVESALDADSASDEDFFNRQAEFSAFAAAGCKLMGYSGIMLNGIESSRQMENFLDKFDYMLGRYPSFQLWAEAWLQRFKEAAPLPFSPYFVNNMPFYLYESLMNPEVPYFDINTAKPLLQEMQAPSLTDIVQSKLAAPDTPQWIKKTVKGIIRGKDSENMADCFGIDNASCPKQLTIGPCGGSSAEGNCEDGCGQCFFNRIIRLGSWSRQMDFLEGSGY